MSDLSFDDATVETGSNYLTPGIHNVKITEIKTGKSSKKGTPFIEFTVTDKAGQTATNQYYTSTTVSEGKTKSAWDISKNSILQLIGAVLNTDADTTKAKLTGFTTVEQMAQKLSTMIVGKEFSIKLNGEWVNPTDTTKQPWVKALFGSGTFAVPTSRVEELKYDPAKNIKGAPVTQPTSTTAKTADITATW